MRDLVAVRVGSRAYRRSSRPRTPVPSSRTRTASSGTALLTTLSRIQSLVQNVGAPGGSVAPLLDGPDLGDHRGRAGRGCFPELVGVKAPLAECAGMSLDSGRAPAQTTGPGAPYHRCDDCRRQLNRTKYQRRRRTAAERRRRQDLIAEHVRVHGWICPGWNRPAHASTDLTADHLTPQARGGAPESAIRVLCRSCNAARGDASSESTSAGAATLDGGAAVG